MNPYIYPIIEHQAFGADEIFKFWKLQDKSLKSIPQEEKEKREKAIQERAERFYSFLEEFLKSQEDNDKFLKHFNKTKLKAKNHVGIIQTPYGTLEILPKCFREESLPSDEDSSKEDGDKETNQRQDIKEFFSLEKFENQDQEIDQNQKISNFKLNKNFRLSAQSFLQFCLSTFNQSLFKQSQLSSLHTQNTPLLDVFIQMFFQELDMLISRGIRHDYVTTEENRTYLKGKLLFSEHIRHNLVHKERFYTSSDEYIADIAPNRLIKSTLLLLKSLSTSYSTLTQINQALEVFEEISESFNIEGDFLSCTASRHFDYYENVLEWCKLFLEGKSFNAYSGESKAYALLFPMERLFESYVAYMLIQNNQEKYTIQAQKSDKSLLCNENDESKFQLRVDLHITKPNNEIIIADTKWKPLKNTEDKKHGIAQADLYQLFAYAHYHNAQEVWLIYPKPYSKLEEGKESQEIKTLLENIEEWNGKKYSYKHDISFKCDLDIPHYTHKIKIKILFAPLVFH